MREIEEIRAHPAIIAFVCYNIKVISRGDSIRQSKYSIITTDELYGIIRDVNAPRTIELADKIGSLVGWDRPIGKELNEQLKEWNIKK